jgi:hypothetical protein
MAVTLTPGRGVPDSSRILPWTTPVSLDWARAIPDKRMKPTRHADARREILIIPSLLERLMKKDDGMSGFLGEIRHSEPPLNAPSTLVHLSVLISNIEY